jgi:hypothetical protein
MFTFDGFLGGGKLKIQNEKTKQKNNVLCVEAGLTGVFLDPLPPPYAREGCTQFCEKTQKVTKLCSKKI